MKLDINNYPGSKGASGLTQWIINHVPECKIFQELFTGSGRIGRALCVSSWNGTVVFTEKSETVVAQLREAVKTLDSGDAGIVVFHRCGLEQLKRIIALGSAGSPTVVYADPPYIKDSRRADRDIYEHEWTLDDHNRFIDLVLQATFPVIISHYDHPLYNERLKGWFTSTTQTMTRGGVAVEKIYMNYDHAQMKLATYDFLGRDYIDRQRISRRKKAYLKKFAKMPKHEREAILQEIQKSL